MKPEDLYRHLPDLKADPPRHIWRSIEQEILKRQERRFPPVFYLKWAIPFSAALLIALFVCCQTYFTSQQEITTYYALVEAFDFSSTDLVFDM